ncbi:MAG: hypothetical protein HZA89_15370 [Verrucomicrobia bacterium]|nr:hypothetical protein [Verrucomicrobiota bacterium]
MREILISINRILEIVSYIVLALVLTGCYTIGVYPKNTVKKIADVLDTVPLGTPLEQMLSDPRMSKLNFQKPMSARYAPIGSLIVNPFDGAFRSLCLYRQFPPGILLEISEDDLRGGIRVSETIDESGEVEIFYDKSFRFKGYFAYSFVRYSDDGGRLQVEKNKFHEFGMEDLSRRCRQWAKFVGAGAEKEKFIPHLPLSQYIDAANHKNQE